MDLRRIILVCVTLLSLSSAIEGFNILLRLRGYPAFRSSIARSGLIEEINAAGNVTILALEDAAMQALGGKSKENLKAVLSTHIIIGFYDLTAVLGEINWHEHEFETLFQRSGKAKNRQGYIRGFIFEFDESYEVVGFTSAEVVSNSSCNSTLVLPLNMIPEPGLSIFHISNPIVTPGI